jgi:Na+-transporting NADH:ubiquinone oxidoreductase subunit B
MYRFFQTLKDATKSFLTLSNQKSQSAPFLRDCIDLKRIMMLVVIALIPCTLVAWINTGLQDFVYTNNDPRLIQEYLSASQSMITLTQFCLKYATHILLKGAYLFFIPLIIIYTTGGLIEAFFATIEKKQISEGFLVTGILTALILPPTLPYWMIVFGVATGLILSKELFGGTGMNIFNPALTIRCILYFTFPTYMTGQVFVEKNNNSTYITSASALSAQNSLPAQIKNIHIQAIGSIYSQPVSHENEIRLMLAKYNPTLELYKMSVDEVDSFVTSQRGLGLSRADLSRAKEFTQLYFGVGLWSNTNLISGNMIGSMGETSKIAIVLGAIFLIFVRLVSLRIIVSMILGALCLNFALQLSTMGPFSSAAFALPIYKQFLIGSFLFGLIFMATEPVTAPKNRRAQYIYGFLIGVLTILIRLMNPAYVEGVMLAILIGNACSSLMDYTAINAKRKKLLKRLKT